MWFWEESESAWEWHEWIQPNRRSRAPEKKYVPKRQGLASNDRLPRVDQREYRNVHNLRQKQNNCNTYHTTACRRLQDHLFFTLVCHRRGNKGKELSGCWSRSFRPFFSNVHIEMPRTKKNIWMSHVLASFQISMIIGFHINSNSCVWSIPRGIISFDSKYDWLIFKPMSACGYSFFSAFCLKCVSGLQ